MRELYNLDLSENTIKAMYEMNPDIKDLTDLDVIKKIELLRQIGCKDNEIRNIISSNSTYLTSEDVITYAKEIAPEVFEDESADLDTAYDILVDEFDEHDDIPDIYDLKEYIEDRVQSDYIDTAYDQYNDKVMRERDDEVIYSNYKRDAI